MRVSRVHVVQPYCSPGKIVHKLAAEGTVTSKATVMRDLRVMGYRALRRPTGPTFFVGDAQRRVAFSRHMLRLLGQGVSVVFSDEKYCSSNDGGSGYQWCQPGERAAVRGYEKWSSKVHVWGLVGIGIKVLVILPHDQRVNAKVYVKKCLRPNLGVIRGVQGRMFMQDGASAHTAKDTKKFLDSNRVKVLDWPPRSPDLNPIERMWAILGAKLEGCGATSVAEMERAVLRAWASIPQSTIDSVVASFTPKLQECIAQNGELVRG